MARDEEKSSCGPPLPLWQKGGKRRLYLGRPDDLDKCILADMRSGRIVLPKMKMGERRFGLSDFFSWLDSK